MPKKNSTIICTGFDVFAGNEDKNASWEAVKLLPDQIIYQNFTFDLKKIKVPVSYSAVDKLVEEIWASEPLLVIHCGVSSKANHITLESCSYNRCYVKPDFFKKSLEGFADLKGNKKDQEILETNLNVTKIVKELNAECQCEDVKEAKFLQEENQHFKCSVDVGDYLCGYIYLKSLDVDQNRTLFIHVPPINQPYSSEETKDHLMKVIYKSLAQLNGNNLL